MARRTYTEDFRIEAVKQVTENGYEIGRILTKDALKKLDNKEKKIETENYGKTHYHSPTLAKSVISLHSSSEIPLSSLN